MVAANRRILRQMSLSLLLALFGVAMSQAAEPSCGQYGTALQWTADTNAAFSQARKQSKLVLMLHLSGNFTKSTFT